jgi:hypothetical protein
MHVVEARDERGASRRAYVEVTATPAIRAPGDYITARADGEKKIWRVAGKTYRIEQMQDAIYYRHLSILGNDGVWTPNLVDRLKVRVDASFFFGAFRRTIAAEELYRQHVDAWIDGPVRVIAQARGILRRVGSSTCRCVARRCLSITRPTLSFPSRLTHQWTSTTS